MIKATRSTVDTVKRMIRNEFDKTEYWEYEKVNELILTAKSYGFEDLAEEMQNDI